MGQCSRSAGRALVVGNSAGRGHFVEILLGLGYQCVEVDDPYTAMAELCRRPLAFRCVVLCLGGIYREELPLVATVKQRFPHLDIWLTQTDGRAAALAEASRLGADGLLSEEGLHPFTVSAEHPEIRPSTYPAREPISARPAEPGRRDRLMDEPPEGEAVLTAEELKALLQDSPRPHGGEPS